MRCHSMLAYTLFCFIVSAAPVTAQEFSGTFTVPNDVGGVMTVSLEQLANGAVSGTLSSNGATFQMQGEVQDGILFGALSGAQAPMWFEAERSGYDLWLTLFGSDADGQPNFDDYTEIDLVAASSVDEMPPGAESPQPEGVLAGGQPSAGRGILGGGGSVVSDPYVGTFSDGSVVLELQGEGGQYQGQVTVNGSVYPVSASGDPDGLQGLIQAPRETFPMTLSPTSGGLIVVEGGAQYDLARQFGAPGGGVGQPSAPRTAVGQTGIVRPGSAGPQVVTGPQGAVAEQSAARELAPGFTFDHPLVREWQTFLSGKKVTRMNSYSSGTAGGYSARTDVYLCSDRRFAMREESSVSVDVGGAFGNSGGLEGGEGNWYLITNGQVVGLVLEFDNGQTEEYRMDYQNEETYANGERVYVTPAEVCY